MDFIKGIIKKMDELPPIFYESEIKEPEPKNIDEIRKKVKNEVKNMSLTETNKEIDSLKKKLLKVHK
tara:strand:+ start:292 stop:492 length:201 start_codon:yes stop_codon:yes gene_type:complete